MKIKVLALAMLLGCSTLACASVVYTFHGTSDDWVYYNGGYDNVYSFVAVAPTYITPTAQAGIQITSCSALFGTCVPWVFWGPQETAWSPGSTHDALQFTVSNCPFLCGTGTFGDDFYFTAGAFAKDGTYSTDLLSGIHDGTMVVSNESPVPEPSAFYLLGAGLLCCGFQLIRAV